MFNRMTAKLRNRTRNSDKNFAYGKMQQEEEETPHRELSNSDGQGSGELWNHVEKDPEDDAGAEQTPKSFAESLFPLDPVVEPRQGHSNGDQDGSVSSGSSLGAFYHVESSKRSVPGSVSVVDQEMSLGPPVLREYEDAEEDFLGEYEEYFEHLSVDAVRKEQYPKLDTQRLVYLDYARCGLYSLFQVEEHLKLLMEEAPCLGTADLGEFSQLSNHIADAQDSILRLMNTDRSAYSVVFTTGFLATFRIVGEAYPFQRNTPILLCQDNHEAVGALINLGVGSGARPVLALVGETDFSVNSSELRRVLGRRSRQHSQGGLFVFPVQSCATGVLHSLNWIAEAHQNGWHVLIDASTSLSVELLDLSLYQPEFVIGSIPHLLGYPAGVGFVLVRKEVFTLRSIASSTEKKVNFIPATVSSSKQEEDCVIVDEDNSLNPLTLAAVHIGIRHLEIVGQSALQKRVGCLAAWLLQMLLSLRHKGEPGAPLTKVYGPLSTRNRGNVLAFSVIDSTGSVIPPRLVQKLALKNNIVLSAGNLDSPGVMNLLGKKSDRLRDTSVFDLRRSPPQDLSLLRVSLGPMSTFRDVYRMAQFLSSFRDEDYLANEAMDYYEDNSQQRFS